MNPFTGTRTRRSTAFAVLLVWLFALSSGVANACLLQAPDRQATAALEAASVAGPVPAAQAGHPGQASGHDEGSEHHQAPCQKVCDDGKNVVPKAHAGLDHADPATAPLVATLWTASAPVGPASYRPDHWAVLIVGPPFRVRYARLTL